MAQVAAGLGVFPDPAFLAAALPLFEAAEVDAIEWTVDVNGFDAEALPSWTQELLEAYRSAGRLYGHGVGFSLLSAAQTRHHDDWLDLLRTDASRHGYRHLTEHYGFVRAGSYVDGAPFPTPMNASLMRLAQGRLARLRDAARCPVGLENLALAMTSDDANRHGETLDALLTPVDGILLLDLHNLYCQIENFSLEPMQVLKSYPLHRVRELHISGGSWEQAAPTSTRSRIRRDTHDGPVPEGVFSLLGTALPICANLELVILERMPHSLVTEEQRQELRDDFARMRELVTRPIA